MLSDRGSCAVVVTCFDLGRTIEAAVRSALDQTRPPDEIVVVDDGSTDVYTRQVLAKLPGEIRLIRQRHAGVAQARNRGIGGTAADYVVLLDGDDLLEPVYLERTAGMLDDRPELDFVACGLTAFGEADYGWLPPSLEPGQVLVRGGPAISTLFRRQLFERSSGFCSELDGYEDTDFWLSAIERGHRGVVLKESLLRCRVRRSSRYHRAIGPGVFESTMATLTERHRQTVDHDPIGLLIAQEAFVGELRAHERTIRGHRFGLERQIIFERVEIERLEGELTRRGAEFFDWGDLRRTRPFSCRWGLERGRPLDRGYIERFLEQHEGDIQGRVLEIKDPGYARMFGRGRTERVDVVDIAPNPNANLQADLRRAPDLPSGAYDCILLTQTLHLIDDVAAALGEIHRLLAPGGVLLATLPAASPLNDEDRGPDGDFWRVTEAGARQLFAEVFAACDFEVQSLGNRRAVIGFLQGLALEELPTDVLATDDPWCPLLVGVRARKPDAEKPSRAKPSHEQPSHEQPSREQPSREQPNDSRQSRPLPRSRDGRAVILAYHRIGELVPDTHHLCVPAPQFEHQIAYLAERCQPMALDELALALLHGRLPERAVAVTFDDGTLDHLETASPILVREGVPGTFFVPLEGLESGREHWWDRLEWLLLGAASWPRAVELPLGEERIGWSLASAEERRRAFSEIQGHLLYLGHDQRELALSALAQACGGEPAPRRSHRPLGETEILELAARPGLSIGAHGWHHLLLPAHDLEIQMDEVFCSRHRLESLLGPSVSCFAYPYGELDSSTVEVVRAADFLAAVTVEEGVIEAGADPQRLPRWEVKTKETSQLTGTRRDAKGSVDSLLF